MGMALELARTLRGMQTLRFLMAGVVNTLFGYCLYLIGLWAGLSPEIALLVATVIGAFWNYMTVARFVFACRGLARLPMFVATYAVVYVVNALAIVALVAAGIGPAVAQGLCLPFAAALSFILFRTVVFKSGQPT